MKRTKHRLYLVALVLTLTAGGSLGAEQPVRAGQTRKHTTNSAGFDAAAKRILAVLKTGDWAKIRKEADSKVLVSLYYRSGIVHNQQDKRNEYVPSDGMRQAIQDRSTDSIFSYVTTVQVKRDKPLSRGEKAVVTDFCQCVRQTDRPGWIDYGEQQESEDGFLQTGPGIVGKVNSSLHWRVQLEYRKGKWRITELIQTEH